MRMSAISASLSLIIFVSASAFAGQQCTHLAKNTNDQPFDLFTDSNQFNVVLARPATKDNVGKRVLVHFKERDGEQKDEAGHIFLKFNTETVQDHEMLAARIFGHPLVDYSAIHVEVDPSGTPVALHGDARKSAGFTDGEGTLVNCRKIPDLAGEALHKFANGVL